MVTRRPLAKLGLAVFTGVTLTLASATPAWSADTTVSYGLNYASINPNDNNWFEVCDRENDGNGVYVKFQDMYGVYKSPQIYKWDSNGSGGGCGNGYVPGGLYSVYKIHVCEDDFGGDTCRWKDVPH